MPVAVIHHRALLARLPAPGEKTAWQLVHAHPVPSLKHDQVRIRTTYVALNPYDWQGVEFKFGIGEEAKVMGRDGAGIVVDVGAGVTDFQIGDRVSARAGCASKTLTSQRYGSAPTRPFRAQALFKSSRCTRRTTSVTRPEPSPTSRRRLWERGLSRLV